MSKFEAHLTFDVKDADRVEGMADTVGFKFSRIDGDPLMGAKPYCYLTAYDTNAVDLLYRCDAAAALVGCNCLRTKVEQIVYDTKTLIDEIDRPHTVVVKYFAVLQDGSLKQVSGSIEAMAIEGVTQVLSEIQKPIPRLQAPPQSPETC